MLNLPTVSRNLIANLAGTGWTAVLGILAVPIYIKFMGIEAYGLYGFYATLQAVLGVLDLGISPTINREMARYSIDAEKSSEAHDLVRTLEAGYWLIGVIIGAAVLLLAPLIATNWIKPSSIPTGTVQQAILSMGLLFALQWPLSFYQGGLLGLQRQVLLNSLNVIITTIKIGGAILILWLVSPTITAFFLWQSIISGLQVALTTIFLWRSLPPNTRRPRFNVPLIRKVWHFAAGMSGLSILALILTQMDKVILSNLLSLDLFGYYVLAGVIAGSLAIITAPIFNTIFPRFSALVALGDEAGLKQLYHLGSQLSAVLLLPTAAVMAAFSPEILLVWTRNAEIANFAAPIASALVIGTTLNGLTNLPYALQLAHGWTRLGLRINLVFIVAFIPAIYLMATKYGAIGAAACWIMLNVSYLLIAVPLTHRRLLKGEARRWFVADIGPPLVGVAVVVGIARQLIHGPLTSPAAVVELGIVLMVALTTATLLAPQVRGKLLGQLHSVQAGFIKFARRTKLRRV